MKMKTLLIFATLALPCLGQLTDKAAQKKVALKDLKHPVHPCLWEITGQDLKKPSYLFGTCHLSDPRVTTLHPDAQKVFDQADAVYGELKMSPKDTAKIAQLMLRTDGKTVTEEIGPKRAARVNKLLKEINPALSLQAGLDGLHTWAVGITLSTLEEQMKGEKVLDQQLLDKAEKAGKFTAGLETVERQLACFEKMTPAQSLLLIDSTLDSLEQVGGENPIEMIKKVYLTETPEKIGEVVKEFLSHSPDGEKLSAEELKFSDWFVLEFLDKRNGEMAEKIDGILEEQSGHSHFFAVGAAHYTGDTAIQDLLKKKGYTITPKF